MEDDKLYGYMCFYKGEKYPIFAKTTLEAQTLCAKMIHVKKQYQIAVVLVEDDDGKPVLYSPVD